ncbi:hypothetical protein BDB00DRAFT_496509 [Zychaea mexicana]|uniref:uncharacterized protein n=1 Tax=Zychaea mexicana TaxID=64656 RepID=UPI0022FE2DC4|nr:uncharacterized protein BDB00DRAFT_496509 [Zychaea mexicana]KAI9498052.1 hypothetical protein BDB00DRAFT_496509 [Zychaea mexicana]
MGASFKYSSIGSGPPFSLTTFPCPSSNRNIVLMSTSNSILTAPTSVVGSTVWLDAPFESAYLFFHMRNRKSGTPHTDTEALFDRQKRNKRVKGTEAVGRRYRGLCLSSFKETMCTANRREREAAATAAAAIVAEEPGVLFKVYTRESKLCLLQSC